MKGDLGPEAKAAIGLRSGLAAAEELRRSGYKVHVYDRYDRMGGLLVYGIPNFKLEKDIVQRRADLLEQSGVVYHPNFDVGRDATLREIRGRHDAVLIATGDIEAAMADGLVTPAEVEVAADAIENGTLVDWVKLAG